MLVCCHFSLNLQLFPNILKNKLNRVKVILEIHVKFMVIKYLLIENKMFVIEYCMRFSVKLL